MADNESADARTHYWKAQIDAWQASGQSQQAFCKANELVIFGRSYVSNGRRGGAHPLISDP